MAENGLELRKKKNGEKGTAKNRRKDFFLFDAHEGSLHNQALSRLCMYASKFNWFNVDARRSAESTSYVILLGHPSCSYASEPTVHAPDAPASSNSTHGANIDDSAIRKNNQITNKYYVRFIRTASAATSSVVIASNSIAHRQGLQPQMIDE